MIEHHEPPTTRLRLLEGDAGVAPDADAGGDSEGDAKSDAASLVVAPLTVADRVGGATRRAVDGASSAARELWLYPDRLVHVIIHGEAETMAEHRAYVESRGWVPAGMSETAEKAVTAAGLIHYLIVARPLKRAMKAVKFAAGKVDHAADRAVSFYIAAAIVTALIVLLSVYL